MKTESLMEVARQLCERVDWQYPNLRGSEAACAWERGDVLQAATGFIRYLRRRETPSLGFGLDCVRQYRESASQEWSHWAQAAWENALEADLFKPYHSNAFAVLGPEVILVAATPERCRRLAARVMEARATPKGWTDGTWGVTHGICELLSYLWPLEECSEEDLLPLFGWLLVKSESEWKWARRWHESILGTSGHNWWAHTFFGFWMVGVFFPELKDVRHWQVLGNDYLERELAILFEDDGWSKEGAPGYHEFALRTLLAFAALSEKNGFLLPEQSARRLRLIADAGWRLLAPDGDYPMIGDHVRATRYAGFVGQGRPGRSVTDYLRQRAALFSLPEAKFVAEALDPRWKPLLNERLFVEGRDLLPAFRRLAPREPATDAALPRSGYYVMRQDWTPKADYAAIVAGTVGPRITSHKHADTFSFELYSRGRRILVDNGYGPVIEERKDEGPRLWRVSGAAHNTVTVDGHDCVPILREFVFGATVVPTIDDWRSAPSHAYFSGAHEGYVRLEKRVTAVRRKLFYLRGKYWILIDRFTEHLNAEHDYQLHFHLNAPAILKEDGRVVTQGPGGNLLMVPVQGASGKATLEANPHPLDGYENPQHLCYTRRTAGNDLFVTLLVPFEDEQVPDVSVSLAELEIEGRAATPWEVTGLHIAIDGERHLYVDQHMQWNLPWTCAGTQGAGRLFHSACTDSLGYEYH